MEKELVIITGASTSYGMSLAKDLSNEGYPLLLLARNKEGIDALNLPNTICKEVDVTDKYAFESAVVEAEKKFGKTGLLVNNAGSDLPQRGLDKPVGYFELEKMLDVNVMGVMNGLQIVLPGMKENLSGTIINLASLAGIQGVANKASFISNRFEIAELTNAARLEMSKFNVRVLSIIPGNVEPEFKMSDKGVWHKSNGANGICSCHVAKIIKFMYQMPQIVSMREVVLTGTQQGA